jgi:hypothetical protein
MQREELYILQVTACFVVALFVFKMNEILKRYPVSHKEWVSQYFKDFFSIIPVIKTLFIMKR